MPNKNPVNVIDWYPMIPSEVGVKHLTHMKICNTEIETPSSMKN